MSRRVRVTLSEARRVALAAQGFDRKRPDAPADVRHFRRAMAAIAVLQLDFVNVLMPAHFLMIWSRLGHITEVALKITSTIPASILNNGHMKLRSSPAATGHCLLIVGANSSHGRMVR